MKGLSRLQDQPIKKAVRLGDVVLGEGMVKICVPVMGGTIEEIACAAAQAAQAKADLIELRIDSLSPMPEQGEAIAACRAAKKAAGRPVLFTMRTARDGGPGSKDTEAYEALLTAVAQARACEAIDCELSVGEAAFMRIVQAAHAADVKVVGSSHEFGEIGDMQRAAQWLRRQEALGADVCKAAVMTRSSTQVLEAALAMARAGEAIACPMIAIAMGPAGVLTRIGGACMGSCLSFGTAGKASAPGQIDAIALRGMLETIHAAMGM